MKWRRTPNTIGKWLFYFFENGSCLAHVWYVPSEALINPAEFLPKNGLWLKLPNDDEIED